MTGLDLGSGDCARIIPDAKPQSEELRTAQGIGKPGPQHRLLPGFLRWPHNWSLCFWPAPSVVYCQRSNQTLLPNLKSEPVPPLLQTLPWFSPHSPLQRRPFLTCCPRPICLPTRLLSPAPSLSSLPFCSWRSPGRCAVQPWRWSIPHSGLPPGGSPPSSPSRLSPK